MTSYFMLIATDARSISTEKTISAYEITLHRLRQRMWPLYASTRHRDAIIVGDKALFYIGGHKENRQSYVAAASVSASDYAKRRSAEVGKTDLDTHEPFKILKLDAVEFFERPVEIKGLAHSLSFVPKSRKWGAAIMGGCRRLTASDFATVLRGSGST